MMVRADSKTTESLTIASFRQPFCFVAFQNTLSAAYVFLFCGLQNEVSHDGGTLRGVVTPNHIHFGVVGETPKLCQKEL